MNTARLVVERAKMNVPITQQDLIWCSPHAGTVATLLARLSDARWWRCRVRW